MQLCGADNPYLSPEKLQEKHKEIMEACITQFRSTRKLGGGLYSERYEKKLEEQIKEAYELFVKRNESKHILNAYRTPVVLTLLIVLSYIVSSILDFLGVESLSKTAVWGLYVPLLLVAVWMYVRYSGNFREVGEMIDNVTTAVWENVSGVYIVPLPPPVLRIQSVNAEGRGLGDLIICCAFLLVRGWGLGTRLGRPPGRSYHVQ